MPRIRFVIDTLTQAHVQCVEGIRRYLAREHLNWDFGLVTRAERGAEPADTWWIVFRGRDLDGITIQPDRPPTYLFGGSAGTCFELDQAACGRVAVQHLSEQGYKTVGLINTLPSETRTRRRQAIAAACEKYGLSLTQHQHNNIDEIPDLIAWLQSSPRPLALCAYTDEQAVWLHKIISEANLAIPDDIALLGVGDIPKLCLNCTPPISSIPLPWALIGEAAAKHVQHLILSGKRLQPERLQPRTVTLRPSTAARKINDPVVRQAYEWLANNLAAAQPLGAVAKHCGYSFQMICLRFQKEFGTSPKQVHDRLRCAKAVQLLSDPHLSIATIAKQTGFSSSTAFGVAF